MSKLSIYTHVLCIVWLNPQSLFTHFRRIDSTVDDMQSSLNSFPSHNLRFKVSKRRARVLLPGHNVARIDFGLTSEKRLSRPPTCCDQLEKKRGRRQEKPEFSIHTDVYGRSRGAPGPPDEIASGISIQHISYFNLKTPPALSGYYFEAPTSVEADFVHRLQRFRLR